MQKIPNKTTTVDKDFEGTLREDRIINIAKMLNRNIYHDGILIAETTETMVDNYPEVMGKTIEEAAVEYILSKSKDGTILNGIECIIKETEDSDYPAQIGFVLSEMFIDEWNEQNK